MGADRDRNSTALAQEIGAIDRVVSLEEGARTADVVVLATPVDHIQRIITDCLDQLSASAVLIDMGSTKQQIVDQVREHPRRGQYVAAHPIAGREKSGPAAARADLMQDHTMIVCDPQDSAPDALRVANTLFESLRMSVVYAQASDHDLRLAYTSHLPHMLAFALSNTILDEAQSVEMGSSSGGGLRSVIRLALHAADMWTPIFMQNQTHVKDGVDKLILKLTEFSQALAQDDAKEVHRLVAKANQIEELINRPV